jgi:uncharacterized protein YigE (DUF2233 family)
VRLLAILPLLALWLSSCSAGTKPSAAELKTGESAEGACRALTFEGDNFTHCLAAPNKQVIETALAGKDGKPMRSFRALENHLGTRSTNLAFAMNAGMYDDDGNPIGYYVENGSRLKKLNRNKGGGNFHLLPNGVFSVEADGWHVRTSDQFADTVFKRPSYATQSGPMLIIGGKYHPDIAENGTSLHRRNAVGIDAKGNAHFIISENAVSFGRLARLMRNKLGCVDALYLDGSVSSLWYPAGGRMDGGYLIGPMLVIRNMEKGSE